MTSESFEQLVASGAPPLVGKTAIPAPVAHAKPSLTTISASELQHKDIPPLQFIVEDFIATGLTILCSPPKYYKSWMMLDLGLQVSSGKPFLQHATNQCSCLYLALEDGERRLKDRMERLLDGEDAPASFYFATSASTLKNGLCDMLDDFLKIHPDIGLIIIDTFQFVRDSAFVKESPYATDYREVSILKRFADKHGIALLLVHHLRKMKDDGDPFNMISGTNGIMAAADTTMVLTKDKRCDANTTLSFISRDVEASETVLAFNQDTCRWSVVGSVQDIAAQQNRRSYETNPIIRTVKTLLAQNPDGWQGTMSELLTAGLELTGSQLALSPRDLTAKLQTLDDLLVADGITHTRTRHGTGGGKHQFQITPTAEDILNIPLPDISF